MTLDHLGRALDPADGDDGFAAELENDRRIDWAEVAREPIDRSGQLPGDALDPALERIPVVELHVDRLQSATADQLCDLTAARRADPTVEAWVSKVNPGFLSDAMRGEAGRTENCAECARAFQSTLEGRPTVAASISDLGLPATGEADLGGGEASEHTEQWAGARFEATTYAEIGQALARTQGSAIVHAIGPEGGHAFNAYWDRDRGTVRWVDAQAGATGDWPPRELRARFTDARAIAFTRNPWT